MKILAVDDEPYILELMPLIASRVGFPDVTTVSSGPLALDLLARDGAAFDCLILDINMPEMDGIELCRRVRAIDAYRRTPIIMLTAMSERDFMDKAFRAGATDYATKPFDISEIGARLRIAQELVAARQQNGGLTKANPDTGAGAPTAPDVPEALVIDGLVDLVALTNYLRQLSRAGLAVSQILSVMVDRFGALEARASEAERLYALGEVATAINAAMVTSIGLMAYTGNGVFVVISNAPTRLAAAEVEAEVQHLLDERNAEFDDGHPMDLEVSVGSPVQPSLGALSDVQTAVDRAIARAATRSQARQEARVATGQFSRPRS